MYTSYIDRITERGWYSDRETYVVLYDYNSDVRRRVLKLDNGDFGIIEEFRETFGDDDYRYIFVGSKVIHKDELEAINKLRAETR